MNLTFDINPETIVDGLIDGADHDQLFDIIAEIDVGLANYNFTERLARHFISELIKEYEGVEGYSFDLSSLDPRIVKVDQS